MGLVNWFKDSWSMMLRTKPQYISILGRKRSSVKSPPKLSSRDGKYGKIFGIFMSVVTMCCSISYGVLLALSERVIPSSLTTYVVSLAIAGLVALSGGVCLSEYISSQSQDTPSIYSSCYQYTSEVLAFFIGWAWIVSQVALVSAVCKILTALVNDWSDDIPRKFLERVFQDYARDVPSLVFLLVFVLFVLTGIGETLVWYCFFIPLAFGMIATTHILGCLTDTSESSFVGTLSIGDVKGIDEVLTTSAVCLLFFSGPQSLLRFPAAYTRKNTSVVLGPLNGIVLVIAFIFITASSLSDKQLISPKNELLNLISNILRTISLSSLSIEAFYPLHCAIDDMSSDGLLFRSFSRKWKPFCFPILSPWVHILSFTAIGLMSVLAPLSEVLSMAVIFPLLVNSIIPYLVLLRRYRDNSTWQYEPMFHTSAKSVASDRSRKKSHEFQYTVTPGYDIAGECDASTACVEDFSDTTSSDTDIDEAVHEYKDQTRVTGTSSLDDPARLCQRPEPTPSSSTRAKFCVATLVVVSLVVSLSLGFADPENSSVVLFVVMCCVFLSAIVQSLLVCLPQNRNRDGKDGCCASVPSMPWVPGMGSLLSGSLLVHCLVKTWRISLGCFAVGALLYFLYGIRSSTAANSFYNMRTTHITLRPLPSYGNNCIPQVIPSQRKTVKSRKQKKNRAGSL